MIVFGEIFFIPQDPSLCKLRRLVFAEIDFCEIINLHGLIFANFAGFLQILENLCPRNLSHSVRKKKSMRNICQVSLLGWLQILNNNFTLQWFAFLVMVDYITIYNRIRYFCNVFSVFQD